MLKNPCFQFRDWLYFKAIIVGTSLITVPFIRRKVLALAADVLCQFFMVLGLLSAYIRIRIRMICNQTQIIPNPLDC